MKIRKDILVLINGKKRKNVKIFRLTIIKKCLTMTIRANEQLGIEMKGTNKDQHTKLSDNKNIKVKLEQTKINKIVFASHFQL